MEIQHVDFHLWFVLEYRDPALLRGDRWICEKLAQSCYLTFGHPVFYGRPILLDCPDVRPLPDVRRSTIEAFLRISRTLRTYDTFTREASLWTSGLSGRPCTGCPAQLGRLYPVHWIVGHTFHNGRSSDDCRTSGPICASGRPTFFGRPAHLVPQTFTFTHHLYIYLFLPWDKVDHSL